MKPFAVEQENTDVEITCFNIPAHVCESDDSDIPEFDESSSVDEAEALNMDDCEFFDQDESPVSFLSENHIESLCIQLVCQPIVAKLITKAVYKAHKKAPKEVDQLQTIDMSPTKKQKIRALLDHHKQVEQPTQEAVIQDTRNQNQSVQNRLEQRSNRIRSKKSPLEKFASNLFKSFEKFASNLCESFEKSVLSNTLDALEREKENVKDLQMQIDNLTEQLKQQQENITSVPVVSLKEHDLLLKNDELQNINWKLQAENLISR